jgi:glucose dehydrogenase
MVHHDMWDTDGVGTSLLDIHRNGITIPAVAGLSKSGLLFILDRKTGKPIFGVEERPVPKSDVPGEESWPTQPFPLKPPPLTRMSMTAADLTTMTPISQQACAVKWATAHNSGPYTPIGITPTVNFPSAVGAANWGGVSVDPTLGYVFVNTSEFGVLSQMVSSSAPTSPNAGGPPAGAGGPGGGFPGGRGGRGPSLPSMPYRNASATQRFVGPDGFPCQRPPWGLLTAVNANTGDIAWQVPLGNYDDLDQSAASSSALTAADLPDTPGKTQTVTICSNCHALSTVTSMRLSKDAWTDVVNTMVSRGLQVNDADKALILNYLATNLAPTASVSGSPPASAAANAGGRGSSSAKPTGTANMGASLVTAGGLVFIGGTLDNMIRAFDSQTGKELWSAKLDGVGYSGTITYMGSSGKQMVATTIGGPGNLRAIHNHASDAPNEVVAFTLP